MTDNEELRNEPVDESVQAVVDRVLSYQGGAEVEVVRQELQDGLSQIGAEMPSEWVEQTARQISDAQQSGA